MAAMYADVFPLQRLPRTLGPFTYRIPDKKTEKLTEKGSWVTIPFRGRVSDGIVWALRDLPPPGVQKLLSIVSVDRERSLTREQYALADFLATRSIVSPAVALSALLPTPTKPKISPKSDSDHRLQQRLTLPKQRDREIVSALRAVPQNDASVNFFPLATLAERVACILHCAQRSYTQKRQMLVVAPTQVEALRIWSALGERLAHRSILLHGSLSKGAYWERWQRVRRTPNAIVISTRQGLGAPFCSLGYVIVDLESDPSHKQADQNPRYHARTLALELARLQRAPLLCLDAQPTLALTLLPALRQAKNLLPIPQRRLVVDLTQQQSKTFRERLLPVSTIELLQAVTGPVLVFYNRRGAATSLRCNDCSWVLRCAKCMLTVPISGSAGAHCHRCGTKAHIPEFCPDCGSARLTERGVGVESVMTMLQQALPKRRVERCDREDAHVTLGETSLVIATERILYLPLLPQFAMIVVLHLDHLLQFPDFSVAERAYLLIERLAALAVPGADVVLQTDCAEQPLLRALRKRDPELLYQEERAVRRSLAYPPLLPTIKLLGSAPTRAAAEASAAKVAKLLTTLPHELMRWSGPWTPSPERSGRQYRRYFQLTDLSGEKDLATLRAALTALPDTWHVDTEPDTFS